MKSAQEIYKNIWKLRHVAFPTILIDVLSSSGKSALTLLLNLENWDFLPPSATLISLNLRVKLIPEQVPGAIEDPKEPLNHIVYNKNKNSIWFCSPGFYEYHEHYPEDRWEHVRGTDQGTITWIVERACSLIDRTKLP